MRIISTFLFSFLAFHSSAQLKESIVAQLFTTGRPLADKGDFKVQVCNMRGVFLPQPRDFSDLHLPVYKREEPMHVELICGGYLFNATPGMKTDTIKKNESTAVVIYCPGISRAPKPKQDTVKNQLVCKTGGLNIEPAKKDTVPTVTIRGTTSIATACLVSGTVNKLNIQTISSSVDGKMTCVNKNPGKADTTVIITGNCWVSEKNDSYCGTFLHMQNKDTTQATRKATVVQQPIRLVGCRTINGEASPLIIVNGVPLKPNTLSELDPGRIEKIEIVKGAQAMALFGKDGENGVIWITLKLNYKQFVVIDSIDKTPVARATTGITMKNDDNTIFYAADDKGVFSSNSPAEFNGLKMTITAVGYKTATRYFNGDISKTDTILLSRDIKTCGEVIVSGTWCPKRITCSYRITRLIPRGEKEEETNAFTFYPNPAPKGSTISISFKKAENNISYIRVLSLGGMEMLKQRVQDEKGILSVQTDPRWSAGVYFVQLVYENGRVAASERIIIQ